MTLFGGPAVGRFLKNVFKGPAGARAVFVTEEEHLTDTGATVTTLVSKRSPILLSSSTLLAYSWQESRAPDHSVYHFIIENSYYSRIDVSRADVAVRPLSITHHTRAPVSLFQNVLTCQHALRHSDDVRTHFTRPGWGGRKLPGPFSTENGLLIQE